MRVDPSAAGWSVTFVCFGAVGVVQDGCDARWARRRRGTCRVRLRRNGRRRVVWMMMMWRPSIASLSLEINLSRFGFGFGNEYESFGLVQDTAVVSRALLNVE